MKINWAIFNRKKCDILQTIAINNLAKEIFRKVQKDKSDLKRGIVKLDIK